MTPNLSRLFDVLLLIAVTISFVASAAAQGTYTANLNREYANIGGRSMQLDIYVPNGISAATPLVVWIHGGGWSGGSRSLSPSGPQLRQATRGYAVASVSYRLSGIAKFPAQINDVKAAIRWLKANATTYNIDPNKIAVWGSSAGGHLAALAGTSGAAGYLDDMTIGVAGQNSRVQAVVDWFGPTDLLRMDATALPCSSICHDCAGSPESELIGCMLRACRPKARRPNPIRYIDPTVTYPPFLIMHGSSDCAVPPNQSQILHDALVNAGVASTLRYLPGEGHGGPQFTNAENLALVDSFLDTHLREESTRRFPSPLLVALTSVYVAPSIFGQ